MIIKYADIHQKHIKQNFLSKTNPVISHDYKLEASHRFINYTTFYHSTQQHFGVANQLKSDVDDYQYTLTLQYIYFLCPEFHFGYRFNRHIKKSSQDLSLYYNISPSTQLAFNYNLAKKRNKYKILFSHNDSGFVIKENKVKLFLFPFNIIKPYLKTDFNNTTIGLKLQLKQFELFTYKSIKNEEQNHNLAVGISLNAYEWKFGFKLFMNSIQGYVSLFVQKSGIAVQFPILQLNYENNVHKYTTLMIMIAIGCTILKCFQQPKILPLNRQQRIDQSRNKLILLEDRTKAIYKHEKNNGLIIMYAYYGNSQHINILYNQQDKQKYQLQNELEVIDVTLACQFMVKNSTLNIPQYSKQVLYGFCDPCEDIKQDKSLLLEYDYKGDRFSKVYKDLDEIKLP